MKKWFGLLTAALALAAPPIHGRVMPVVEERGPSRRDGTTRQPHQGAREMARRRRQMGKS